MSLFYSWGSRVFVVLPLFFFIIIFVLHACFRIFDTQILFGKNVKDSSANTTTAVRTDCPCCKSGRMRASGASGNISLIWSICSRNNVASFALLAAVVTLAASRCSRGGVTVRGHCCRGAPVVVVLALAVSFGRRNCCCCI